MTTKRTVGIIGSGPAALLACHAAVISGCQPTMYSPTRRPPQLHGAQYLHSYVPEMQLPPPFFISYTYHGTKEGYAEKIYGDPTAGCSWGKFGHEVVAWNLDAIARDLCFQYQMLIKETTIQPGDLYGLTETYDIVINTAPLHSIAPLGEFEVEYVWVAAAGNHGLETNSIHYYGDERPEYRRSYIMGKGQVEWPDSPTKPQDGAIRLPKPLRARTHVPGVHLLGRYGQWKKGVLVDQVFQQAMEIFKGERTWEVSQAS